MNLTSLFFIFTLFLQDVVPFKAKEDFEVKIDLKFKQRPQEDKKDTFTFDSPEKKANSAALLPYLQLRVSLLKLDPEEVRFNVQNNLNRKLTSKKINKTPAFEIDAGFTDDIKAKIQPNEYIITMLSSEKRDLSRIVIKIEEDGTFLVNGEKRGKF